MQTTSPIIVAIDVDHTQAALNLMDALDPALCRLKVGKELFTMAGPSIVEAMQKRGFDVFLDLKFHDIPNTVASAVKVAAELGVWMVDVHALGGRKMMCDAKEILSGYSNPPLLIAVTLLTSMSDEMANEIGLLGNKDEIVTRLANLVAECGLDGVVSSANEASMIKSLQPNLRTVCPGIRLDDTVKTDDQVRIMTPQKAVAAGADYLVIGRPITRAADPREALHNILSTLSI
ncbi:orotidine-5'-phosphate decarboxylase [Wohlfahrtiimonas chitiniclastica]|uniref:orotidine-5'-phosphate decarboxylase n=1 Tax=Wohlfahrtiimonas chitiniclastica TaxID=400946 RepID=UPI00036352EB|nr:orotidine-5'-phosphate decarboxylase [Wohlfahrtiimonas chitiniclastica]